MNERIKELWDKAGKTHSGESWEELTAFMNCFAELIVRECAEVARLNTRADSKVNLMIKQHFGVKE